MTRTAALPTYEEFVAGCRKDAAERVLVERRGDHAVVTMHDPERLNALSGPLTVQLLDRLRRSRWRSSPSRCASRPHGHRAGVAALR
jgi:hypothetical protein